LLTKFYKLNKSVHFFRNIYRLIFPATPNQRNEIKKSFLGSIFYTLFNFSDSSFWIIYNPDSSNIRNLHPEFKDLYKSWIRGNKLNNGGDLSRFFAFILNLKMVIKEGIPGSFAELGVWRGNSAAVISYFANKDNRKCYLFDTFQGFDERDLSGIDENHEKSFADTSISYVKQTINQPENNKIIYVPGYFPQSITQEATEETYAFVSVDCDLYEPMKQALLFFYPKMSKGGYLFLHDYSSALWEGGSRAIDEFLVQSGEYITLLPDKSGTAVIRKTK
jgi:hypothetical protein